MSEVASGTVSHYHAFELTKQGYELRQAAIAYGRNAVIEFTKGQIGEGRPASAVDIYYMTGLADPAFDVPIKESYADGLNHIMTVVVDNTVLARELLMTEIGIFARLLDTDGSEIVGETLYGYTYTDKFDYVPVAVNYFLHREISFNTVLSREGNFTIVFDGSKVYATARELADAVKLLEDMIRDIGLVTYTEDGLMSKEDKTLLDGMAAAFDAKLNSLSAAFDSKLSVAGGVVVQTSAPAGNPQKLWVNSATGVAYYWNGAEWKPVHTMYAG